jgi:hypothetical protein
LIDCSLSKQLHRVVEVGADLALERESEEPSAVLEPLLLLFSVVAEEEIDKPRIFLGTANEHPWTLVITMPGLVAQRSRQCEQLRQLQLPRVQKERDPWTMTAIMESKCQISKTDIQQILRTTTIIMATTMVSIKIRVIMRVVGSDLGTLMRYFQLLFNLKLTLTVRELYRLHI